MCRRHRMQNQSWTHPESAVRGVQLLRMPLVAVEAAMQWVMTVRNLAECSVDQEATLLPRHQAGQLCCVRRVSWETVPAKLTVPLEGNASVALSMLEL
jgi:hypothetical protein